MPKQDYYTYAETLVALAVLLATVVIFLRFYR